MEKNQYDLCLEILRRFHEVGVLKHFVLIGSWCLVFYKDYFSLTSYREHTTLRTRDMDFLITRPTKISGGVDIPTLLKDLGFVTSFQGKRGYIKLDHPELIVEFLIAERGRGMDTPFTLPKLGINATPLRYLDFLASKVVTVRVECFELKLPHPVNFSLHKLIISQRRRREDKAQRDKLSALRILQALVSQGELGTIRSVFDSLRRSWQKKILAVLKEDGEDSMLELLSKSPEITGHDT